MNKRQKLKKGKMVPKKDTYNLDQTIADFVLPRLILFKKVNNAFPGRGDMNTPEKWDAALDKMIYAFGYMSHYPDWNEQKESYADYVARCRVEDAKIKEGMHLFAEWYSYLWW